MRSLVPAALVALFITACASNAPAPVVTRNTAPEPIPAARAAGAPAAAAAAEDKNLYTVKKGDTLYSIALEHGRDYKDIAAWNGIDNPNRIQVGQQLRTAPPEGEAAPVAVTRPIVSSGPVVAAPVQSSPAPAQPAGAAAAATPVAAAGANTETFKTEPKGGKLAYSEQALARLREPSTMPEQQIEKPAEKPVPPPAATPPSAAGEDVVDWMWPAPGKTLATFADSGAGANKGLDIAGNPGDPVHAAAAGKVVYVGNGLRGYGNLVIVRHNAAFLSAYAHNSKILVKEGQSVARGQKIAEVGSSDADQAKLHFEIRHQGKPVDPLKYLPAR